MPSIDHTAITLLLCWNSRGFQNSVKRVGEGGKARKNTKLYLPDLQKTTISSETKLSRHHHFCVGNQTRPPLAWSRVAADRNPVAKRHYSCDQFGQESVHKLRHRPRRRRKRWSGREEEEASQAPRNAIARIQKMETASGIATFIAECPYSYILISVISVICVIRILIGNKVPIPVYGKGWDFRVWVLGFRA